MRRPFRSRRFRPWRMRRWRRPMPPLPPMIPRRRWYRRWGRGCCLPGCALPVILVGLVLGARVGRVPTKADEP